MTPMIDVTFLLIIFFLVSSHLSKTEHQTPMQLPKAVSGLQAELLQSFEVVTINIFTDRYALGVANIAPEELAPRLARAAGDAENLQVRIRCESTAEYSRVEPVLNACNAAGCHNIVFAVIESP